MNKPNEQTTLEKRAVAALGHDGLTALSAAELIAELTGALAAARQEAAAEEERALDPQQSPDLNAARERRDDAQLKVGRLETLQSQMQRRLSVVRELEWVRNYCEKRDVLQAKRTASSKSCTTPTSKPEAASVTCAAATLPPTPR